MAFLVDGLYGWGETADERRANHQLPPCFTVFDWLVHLIFADCENPLKSMYYAIVSSYIDVISYISI